MEELSESTRRYVKKYNIKSLENHNYQSLKALGFSERAIKEIEKWKIR